MSDTSGVLVEFDMTREQLKRAVEVYEQVTSGMVYVVVQTNDERRRYIDRVIGVALTPNGAIKLAKRFAKAHNRDVKALDDPDCLHMLYKKRSLSDTWCNKNDDCISIRHEPLFH